jgi:hypothetical protein
MKKIYYALSNGDYNAESSTNDMETIRWELETGQQRYIILTEKKLSTKEYTAICKILDRKNVRISTT